MKKSRFSESQIISALKKAEASAPVPEWCRKHGMSSALFYKWRSKYGGMDASMMARLKELEDDNRRLRKMYAKERLNAERLWKRVETLSTFTLPDVPWTRRAFSPLFKEAHAWLKNEFAAAGLEVELDAGGNLIGRRPGNAMHENGIALKHPFEVIDFLSEDPSDYGISCIGSHAFSGMLDAEMRAACNPAGETLAEG